MKLTVIVWAARHTASPEPGLPQALLPLAGRPALQFVLEVVCTLEPSNLILIGRDDDLQHLAGTERAFITWSEQPGTVDAWQQAEPMAAGQAEIVLLLPGDAPLIRPETLLRMVEDHQAEKAIVTRLGGQDKVICFRDDWLWPNLAHLQRKTDDWAHTDQLVALALEQGAKVTTTHLADAMEILTLENGASLAQAETEMRKRINLRWMLAGVRLIHPEVTYIDAGVEIGAGTVVWPNTLLQGQTRIGHECTIGPGSVVRDSTIGDGCRVELSVVEQAIMEEGSNVGPFGHLRKGAHLGPGAHMGNFGEVKNSYLGPGAKMGHFSYVGDATVGAEANIGAGTITCNYDGQRKHRTAIGKEAFIGSGTMLVAPVEVGDQAKTGAGSVVTHDVPAGSVAYGVPARLKATPGAEESEAE